MCSSQDERITSLAMMGHRTVKFPGLGKSNDLDSTGLLKKEGYNLDKRGKIMGYLGRRVHDIPPKSPKQKRRTQYTINSPARKLDALTQQGFSVFNNQRS
jgi:hypothetical protein